MRLFKYLSDERVGIVENGLIRLTQPSSMNDPFDGGPCVVNATQEDIESLPLAPNRLGEPVSYQLTSEFLAKMLQGNIFGIGNATNAVGQFHMIDPLLSLRSKFDSEVGLLSLSATPDSLLMWSHYANEHRGFVLELETEDEFFSGVTSWDEVPRLSPVEYNNIRPVMSFVGGIRPSSILRKSLEWSYEQEWRLLRPLSESDSQIGLDNNGLPICLFQLPFAAIKRIYLGARVSDNFAMRIHNALKEIPEKNHISIHYMKMHRENYSLVIDPHIDEAERQKAINGEAVYALRRRD